MLSCADFVAAQGMYAGSVVRIDGIANYVVLQGMCMPALAAGAAGAPGSAERPPRGAPGPASRESTKGVLDAGASVLDEVHALLSYNAGPPPMEYAPEESFTRCAPWL